MSQESGSLKKRDWIGHEESRVQKNYIVATRVKNERNKKEEKYKSKELWSPSKGTKERLGCSGELVKIVWRGLTQVPKALGI